ncbi:MAG: DUF4860 domain-containing protein [Lachnospiraceae bacterium]|nr:DUF4860 domain-containing protein [Lachnospiraceae bacterium]
MEVKQQKHIIDILFVLTLFGLFALSAIFLISVGADVYSKTVDHMDENFDTRTSMAYVTEKIRQSDKENAISIGLLEGQDAIIITTHISDTNYYTYLYEHDGYLKELMVREGIELGPEAGQNILAVSDFSVTQINDKLMNCQISINEEQTYDLLISVHAGGIANE